MQLLEVKNDTAKIIYNPEDNKLLPSDFLLIEDANQRLAGQILNLYADETSNNNIAEVRLALSIDKDDRLSYYNGYIPPRNAKIIYITADDITEMIADSGENIYLGNLTYHPKSIVKTPVSLVDDRLFIQCGRDDNTKTILQNIVSELYTKRRKIVLFDFDGRYSRINGIKRASVTENFKFPLNIDALDSIFEFDTQDCSLEDKAVIQGIVLELKDYIKTIEGGFLPLTLFKDVVISEFAANPISGLMILRNKLWQYAQDGLFAEKQEDFNIINDILGEDNIVIADFSKIDEKWHKFALQTIPKILNQSCYLAFSLNDIPMDKRSITALYNNPDITPIAAAAYDYPHRELLKSLCKNQILFKPAKYTANIDEHCSSLISKLNADDFILYGSASLDLALIIKLKAFDVKTSEAIAEHELRRNVDKILYRSKSVLPKEASVSEMPVSAAESVQAPDTAPLIEHFEEDKDITDEDLDFIDSIENGALSQEKSEQNNASDVFDSFSLDMEPEAQEAASASEQQLTQPAEETEIHYHLDDEEASDAQINNTEEDNEIHFHLDEDEAQMQTEETFINLKEQDMLEMTDEPVHIKGLNEQEDAEEDNASYQQGSDITAAEETEEEKEQDIQLQRIEETDTQEETSLIADYEAETNDKKAEEAEKADIEAQEAPAEEIESDEPDIPKIEDEPPVNTEIKPAKRRAAVSNSVKTAPEPKPAVREEHKRFSLSRFNKLKEKIQRGRNKEEKKDDKKAAAKKNAPSAPAQNKTAPAAPAVNRGRVQKKDLTVYEPERPAENTEQTVSSPFQKGDKVFHPKYGKGVIEGLPSYSSKISFCLVEFENSGRRILDPRVSGLKKLEE